MPPANSAMLRMRRTRFMAPPCNAGTNLCPEKTAYRFEKNSLQIRLDAIAKTRSMTKRFIFRLQTGRLWFYRSEEVRRTGGFHLPFENLVTTGREESIELLTSE